MTGAAHLTERREEERDLVDLARRAQVG